MADNEWSFTVLGVAVPQGSKTRSKSGHFYEANRNHAVWRKTVKLAAEEQIGPIGLDCPLAVDVLICMPKPQKPKFDVPAVKPDIDKQVRSLFDSITAAGVWVDDSRVVVLSASSIYGDEPFVKVVITKL